MGDIVVVGASAGGIAPLKQLTSKLPRGLPVSVFAVVHTPPWRPSELPRILTNGSSLPARHPQTDDPIEPGWIYVAPPDHHLLIEKDRMRLWRGPKENRHRPAVNPLFRSAAVTYGERVIGVVLSGSQDDGSAGLWWVKQYGGTTIVQHPESAEFPDMPNNALEHVQIDHVVHPDEMGHCIARLVTSGNGAGCGSSQ